MIATTVQIASGAALLWIYVGYGLALRALAATFGKALRVDPSYEPSVSIVVPSFEERAVIARKIEECLALEYPADKIEILVVDSASRDGTAAIVRLYEARGVRLLPEAARRGKAHALASGFAAAAGTIVLATDATATLPRDAVRKIVARFADPSVGAVTTALQNPLPEDRAHDLGLARMCRLFWERDAALKKHEAKLHSAVGLVGEAAAVRRGLVSGEDARAWIVAGGADDTALALHVVARGYRIAFADDVVALKPAASDVGDYVAQKTRNVAQNLRHLAALPRPILRRGWYTALIFPTRRLLSPFSPWLLVLFLASADAVSLALQLAFYGLAALRTVPLLRRLPGVEPAAFFVCSNAAAAAAWLATLRGRDFTVWTKIASTRC